MRKTAIFIILAAAAIPTALAAAQEETGIKTKIAVTDAPVEPNTAIARAELYRLIDELKSIRFRDPASPTPRSSAADKTLKPVAKPQQPVPSDVNSVVKQSTLTSEKIITPVPELPPIVRDPNTVTNPFELAEALYKVGRYREAAACYRVVLSRIGTERQSGVMVTDRAWVQFQIANCCVRFDIREAIKAYKQLITDHPSSEWTPIAMSREELLRWYIDSGLVPGQGRQ